MDKKTLGIGILSWNAHETLKATLDSYTKDGFLDLFDQRIIYFSDISEKDKAIANEYGWDYAGGANEGIAAGMKHLAEHMNTDYILLLQNDNPLVEDADFAVEHIQNALKLIDAGKADLGRMRHRWNIGEGSAATKYLKYYSAKQTAIEFDPVQHALGKPASNFITRCLRRLLKPHNARRFKGRSIYIETSPENIYPRYIQKEQDFLIIDSEVLDFTDQCLLISRQRWLNLFIPYVEANSCSTRSANGFKAPELCINGNGGKIIILKFCRVGGFLPMLVKTDLLDLIILAIMKI